MNASPESIAELADLPIKLAGDATIYLRDVGTVADGYSPQTNIARADGRRGVLMNILKAGNASTIDVVSGVRDLLPKVAQTLPPELKIHRSPINRSSYGSYYRGGARSDPRGLPHRNDVCFFSEVGAAR